MMEISRDTGGYKVWKVRVNPATHPCLAHTHRSATDWGRGGWPTGTSWVCLLSSRGSAPRFMPSESPFVDDVDPRPHPQCRERVACDTGCQRPLSPGNLGEPRLPRKLGRVPAGTQRPGGTRVAQTGSPGRVLLQRGLVGPGAGRCSLQARFPLGAALVFSAHSRHPGLGCKYGSTWCR